MRALSIRGALLGFVVLVVALPFEATDAQQICDTPPGAVACVPFPCLAMEAQAVPEFGCSMPIPPCGLHLAPVVDAAQDSPSDATFCDCPSPCIVVECLPPTEARLSWRGCPIEWEIP